MAFRFPLNALATRIRPLGLVVVVVLISLSGTVVPGGISG